MRAMILAAGRGERLRPLTDRRPKPLLKVGGKSLLCWHLEALSLAGFREIVINLGHLGEQIPQELGDGERWGLRIHYSEEPSEALETGGGIVQAMPWLGTTPFVVVNGDIWCDYPFAGLRTIKCDHAHLVLVPGAGETTGDFALSAGRVANRDTRMHTFSGIAVYHPRLFSGCTPGRFSVVPLLREAVEEHRVTGELYSGRWFDAGTPERLDTLRRDLDADSA